MRLQGKNLRIQVKTAGAWHTIAFASADSLSITNTEVDATSKDSAGWRELFSPGAIKSVDMSLTFGYDKTDVGAVHLFNTTMAGDPLVDARICDNGWAGFYVGSDFLLSDMELAGEVEGFVTASANFKSTGVVLFKAA